VQNREGFDQLVPKSHRRHVPVGPSGYVDAGHVCEYERAMIRERTKSGLAFARERGRVGGRRPKLTPAQEAEVVRRVSSGEATAAEMARLFGVHRSSVTRLIQRRRASAAAP
jgi:DNA invertase Pin-like site-specific DNA recombinase